jgi:xanthine dehydrogenase accessory factor
MGLCTIVGIEGSFSRRLGAQLAVAPDGTVTGSLADGCLERQLAAEVLAGGERRVMRFGAGSPLIDFRLPCGSGLDILVDPTPDHAACAAAVAALDRRQAASLALPVGPLAQRRYVPALRLLLFGEGPELEALAMLGRTAGLTVEALAKDAAGLALGATPQGLAVDPWSAVILLFHDHEWEQAILQWALATPAFFIGAQGGGPAREERAGRLAAAGVSAAAIARIASPIGVVRSSREPVALALSILASVVGAYEALHPHG